MFNGFNQNELPKVEGDAKSLPDLCHKCGKCCRSATTFHPHKKLLELVAAGEQDAIDFLSVFQPYPSVEAARQVEPEQVAHVLEVVANRDDMNVEDITFYHCQFVTEEGLCGIYERRPRCCKEAPGHGWSAMPPGCGFEGWQFKQRESHMANIRRLKELQYHMEVLSDDGVHTPTKNMTLDELRAKIADCIGPWRAFGANYW